MIKQKKETKEKVNRKAILLKLMSLTDIDIALLEDVTTAIKELKTYEVRYLVNLYYQIQHYRIALSNQIFSTRKEKPIPSKVFTSIFMLMENIEEKIKKYLDQYSLQSNTGKWLREIHGIGPVLASGFLAHLRVYNQQRQAPIETAGAFWKFAGLVNDEWKKGEKRPWNPELKVLCWKFGQSLIKLGDKKESVYAKLLRDRLVLEKERNEKGDFKTDALECANKVGKGTVAYTYYSKGQLPQAHILQRAARYAVKIFLSHLHHKMYLEAYGKEPPKPFAIVVLGHAHEIIPEVLYNLPNQVIND